MSSIPFGYSDAVSIKHQYCNRDARRSNKHMNILCTQSKKGYRLCLYGNKVSLTHEHYKSYREHCYGNNGSYYAVLDGKYCFGKHNSYGYRLTYRNRE